MSVLQMLDYLSYSLVLTMTGYIMPLLSLGFLSHRIACFLKTKEGMFDRWSVSFHHPLCVALMSVLMYLLLYSPYHVMHNDYIGSWLFKDSVSPCTHDIMKSLYILSHHVAFAHSIINPALYFFMGDQFRELLISHIWLPYRTQGTYS
ncbi:hypothetical protein Z043_121312 [Scleropages formosus]|uniref:G-protein coupled receptors family 1 profile domain-containing protein n=1 Tax=Scleropages formosus TaxID=113540 RepID=A0A0P7UM50_SCLFO|nr:succinate receptor 1-like [Scleropages formosus]KPP60664.1 hypothetical protein Z043_121312 [Scleropages formosus]